MRHDERLDEDTRLRTEDLVAAGETRPDDRDEVDSRRDDADALPPPRTADGAEYSLPGNDDRMQDDEAYPARASDTDRVESDTDTGMDQHDVDTDTDTERDHPDRDDTFRDDTDADQVGIDNERSDTDEEPAVATDSVPEQESAQSAPSPDNGDEASPLFRSEDVDRFRTEWQQVQTMFVDDPREAVQSADHLVAEVMQALASMFNEHKEELEGHWREGTDVQTEDLRIALRRYRSFFYQLLDA